MCWEENPFSTRANATATRSCPSSHAGTLGIWFTSQPWQHAWNPAYSGNCTERGGRRQRRAPPTLLRGLPQRQSENRRRDAARLGPYITQRQGLKKVLLKVKSNQMPPPGLP